MRDALRQLAEMGFVDEALNRRVLQAQRCLDVDAAVHRLCDMGHEDEYEDPELAARLHQTRADEEFAKSLMAQDEPTSPVAEGLHLQPGRYKVIQEGTGVEADVKKGSKTLRKLKKGTVIEIVEVQA